jgi:hypothetical protein
MNKFGFFGLFAGLTLGSAFAADQSLCTDSALCLGVTNHFAFEEDSDYARESSSALPGFLYEPNGADISRASGKFGYAADFAGTATSYLTTRDGLHLGSASYSISFWIYPDTLGSSGQKQYVLSTDKTTSPGESFYLENVSSSLRPTWQVKLIDGSTLTLQASSGISTGAWHFVVVEVYPAFTESPTANNARIYLSVDGAARTSATLGVPVRGGFGPLRLGGRPQTGQENPFDGRLDHLTFYNGILLDDEISLAYNSGSGRAFPFSTP